MILPCEDNFLRRITMDRYAQRVSRYDSLPRDIELNAVEVIESEISLQRKIDVLKRDLHIRYDYSIYSAFRTIDRFNDGHIDSYNLSSFLKNNGHYAS